MNLAVIIERFDPSAGGAERSTAQIVQHLTARGHHITVLTAYCPDPGAAAPATIRPMLTTRPKHGIAIAPFARWTKQQLADNPYDASLSVTMAVPATLVQPRAGTVRETQQRNIAMRPTPLARLTKRILLALTPKQRLLLRLEKRTATDPSVKTFLAVSQYVSTQLQSHYHIPPDRIRIIPNAADVPAHTDTDRATWRQRVRAGFDIPDDALVYLFAAMNPRLKGSRQLLHAFKQLTTRLTTPTPTANSPTNPILIMAGHPGYREQHLAANLGIRSRVKFVGPTSRMHELYAAADITVHPTFYDPSSKVVIESLIMAVPAITTRYNGAADLIQPQPNSPNPHPPRGRVIQDPTDITTLTNAMHDLANEDERNACAAATTNLTNQLSMTHHVQQLEAVLSDCVTTTS